jgi:hypothetical protein
VLRNMLCAAVTALMLLASACSVANRGMQGERAASDLVPSPTVPPEFAQYADAVESENELLDVVELELLPDGTLNLYVVLINPGTDTEQGRTDAETLIKSTLESLWLEARRYTPEATAVTVNFINLLDVQTFEYGPATSGVVTGAISADMADVSEFLEGDLSPEEIDDFWDSEAIRSQSIGNPYTGAPNHPMRSLK